MIIKQETKRRDECPGAHIYMEIQARPMYHGHCKDDLVACTAMRDV
jgi:hypothetical protein